MPAIDEIFKPRKATHIADRNKAQATFTLCGQPLSEALFFVVQENFPDATCKTCTKLFFGEES